jgi:hypothetical protein
MYACRSKKIFSQRRAESPSSPGKGPDWGAAGMESRRNVKVRLTSLITGALAYVACGLSTILLTSPALSSERTCSRVERNSRGLEIWMWTEPVDEAATSSREEAGREDSSRARSARGGCELPLGETLPEPFPAATPFELDPAQAPPSLDQLLRGIAQYDAAAEPNPLRLLEPPRSLTEQPPTALSRLTDSPSEDRGERTPDNVSASRSEGTFPREAGRQGEAASIDRLGLSGSPPVPPRNEDPGHGDASSSQQLEASHQAVNPGDRRNQHVRSVFPTARLSPLISFLTGVTSCLVVLPFAVYLILLRCARRHGLIVRVEVGNVRGPSHASQQRSDCAVLRTLDGSNQDQAPADSARMPSGSAPAEELRRAKNGGRIEGRSLLKRILDDNTGLRRQIARMKPVLHD